MRLSGILDRYLFFEMIIPFFISMLFFLSIFMMKHLLHVSDMIVNNGADLISMCLLMLYTVPYFLQYVVPISTMIAILMVFLRMTGDNEILILKTSGIGVYRLLKPVILFCAIGVIITGITTTYTLPLAEKFLRSLAQDMVVSGVNFGLKARTFSNKFKNLTVYIGDLNSKTGDVSNVFIEDRRVNGVQNTVIAPRGKIVTSANDLLVYIRLFDGYVGRLDINNYFVHRMEFKSFDVCLDIKNNFSNSNLYDNSLKEMSLFELNSYICANNSQDTDYFEALVRYHKIFAIPFSCLSMGLLALPLGVHSRKFKKSFGVGLSIFFFLVYYILLSTAIAFSESGFYHPAIGIWIPNILLGLLGLFFLVRVANEKPLLIDSIRLFPSKINFARWN